MHQTCHACSRNTSEVTAIQYPQTCALCPPCPAESSGSDDKDVVTLNVTCICSAHTATVPKAQPSDIWQRGSLRSSHARMVESSAYCIPLMVLVRWVMCARYALYLPGTISLREPCNQAGACHSELRLGRVAPYTIRDFRSGFPPNALVQQGLACQARGAAQAALSLCMAVNTYRRGKLPRTAPVLHLGVSVEVRVGCVGVVGPCHILIDATSCFPVVKKHSDDLLAGKYQRAVSCILGAL